MIERNGAGNGPESHGERRTGASERHRTRGWLRDALNAATADLGAELEREIKRTGIPGGPVNGGTTIRLINTDSHYAADKAAFFAQQRMQPWAFHVQVPDGRWQAIKARLQRHRPFRRLKVRTRWVRRWTGYIERVRGGFGA